MLIHSFFTSQTCRLNKVLAKITPMHYSSVSHVKLNDLSKKVLWQNVVCLARIL